MAKFLPMLPVLLGIIGLLGCGQKGLVPVAGRVKVGEQPLAEGYVLFHPDDGRAIAGGDLPRAELNAHGEYQLKSAGGEGAALGKYRVVIISQDLGARDLSQGSGHTEPRPRIERRYFDVKQTPLRVEVKKENKPGDFDFSVEAFESGGPPPAEEPSHGLSK